MIYSDIEQLFADLIQYNELNIEYLGKMQIPMTNIYYYIFTDPKNTKINDFIEYIDDYKKENPFDNIKPNIGIDKEQICKINLIDNTLNQIDKEITVGLNCANESNSKNVIVLDINLIFDLILSFSSKNIENHIYDYLLHKFKNKIDKIFILDNKNILKNTIGYSSIYNELILYFSKNKNNDINKSNISDSNISIYKHNDILYWRILTDDINIECVDINDCKNQEDEELNIYEINGKETIVKTINISKICFTNLFEKHLIVLHPLDKLNITSIFL